MKIIKFILVNTLICFFIYILFEVFSGGYIKGDYQKINYEYLVINKKINRKVNLYTKDYITVKYKRDNFGFKDRFKEIEKIDVVTVGGSTTEQKYLTLQNTWTDILEKKININNTNKIDIVNAGINGQSSKGHLWNLKHWFKKIENFRPKYIIFYMGINESQKDDSKSDPRGYQSPENLSLYNLIKKHLKINNGMTYRLYLKFTLRESDLNKVWHNTDRFHFPYKEINDDAFRYNNFTFTRIENRLEKLNQLTKELGAIPIFVTQNSIRWKKVGEIIYSIDNIDYHYNEMNIAKTIMNFCKKNQIKCIDGFNLIKFNKTDSIFSKDNDTFDLLHTTPSGSKKIAELIYKELNSLF